MALVFDFGNDYTKLEKELLKTNKTLEERLEAQTLINEELIKQLNLCSVSQRSELLFCDFCKEDNPHRKHEHKKMKECEGCGLVTKL